VRLGGKELRGGAGERGDLALLGKDAAVLGDADVGRVDGAGGAKVYELGFCAARVG